MMSDNFDLCECIRANKLLVQRLLSILRQTQHYCTDNECYDYPMLPGPPSVQPSSNFFMACLFVAFIFLMYMLRPRSLRLQNTVVKTRDDLSGSNNDPPTPPPTGN